MDNGSDDEKWEDFFGEFNIVFVETIHQIINLPYTQTIVLDFSWKYFTDDA